MPKKRPRLGENNHARAFVRVLARGLVIDYTVHVARLMSAHSGALRRYPDAVDVQVSRERLESK